jgi:hypothetical protein
LDDVGFKDIFRTFILDPKIKVLLFLFFVAAAILLIEIPYFGVPFSANEGMFTHIAQEMRYGSKLYQDVWDHKPPLLFLHFVLLQDLFGNGEVPVRSYGIIFHFFDTILLFLLVMKFSANKRMAFFAAWAYVFLLLPPYFQAWSLQAELLIQPFLILAFLLACSQRVSFFVLAGVAWAVGFFTKPIALFFLPLFLFLRKGEKIKPALFFFWGADAASIIFALPFLADGRFALLRNAIWGSNRDYVIESWKYFLGDSHYQRYVWSWFGVVLLAYAIPLFAFCMSVVSNVSLNGKMNYRFFLGTWFLLALFSCLVSGYFHPYYYFVLIPPLSMGVGIFLEKLWVEKKFWFAFFIALASFFLLSPWLKVLELGNDGIKNSEYIVQRSTESKDVGFYLKRISKPGQKLFAWVSEAQIYTYSGLKMAILKSPLSDPMGKPINGLNEMESEFVLNRPDYVVISHFDQLPEPPGWLLREMGSYYRKIYFWPHYEAFVLNESVRK